MAKVINVIVYECVLSVDCLCYLIVLSLSREGCFFIISIKELIRDSNLV